MNPTPLLETQALTVGYHRPGHRVRVVIREIDTCLNTGEFVCLLGPNGAGKSTLIRTLAGMQKPVSGVVRLSGELLSSLSARAIARRMSLVLTDRPAVGLMPVATLVAMGRYPYTCWRGQLKQEDEGAVWQAMANVGIEALAHRPVCELSDGERQKVMIARALAQEPCIMVLDEATAFLDLPCRVELMYMLRDLARTGHLAILLSTHDLDLALRCADRLWLLPMEGSLREGAPEDLVLNGAFADAFAGSAGSGAQFDTGSGAFIMPSAIRGSVALEGDSVSGMWTYRALERAGYRVTAEGKSPLAVEVLQNNGVTTWRIKGDNGSSEILPSIELLLKTLPSSLNDGGEEKRP
jgi:iron complex transport system ATP-binding protein